MKSRMNVFVVAALTVFVVAFAAQATESNVDWKTFSQNLVKGLKSDNQGVQESSMQMVIQYGDKVNVSDAVFDVVTVFRSNKDENVRRLALTTLHKMDNAWAYDYLQRHYKFEKSPVVQRQIAYVLNDANAGVNIVKKIDKKEILAELTQ